MSLNVCYCGVSLKLIECIVKSKETEGDIYIYMFSIHFWFNFPFYACFDDVPNILNNKNRLKKPNPGANIKYKNWQLLSSWTVIRIVCVIYFSKHTQKSVYKYNIHKPNTSYSASSYHMSYIVSQSICGWVRWCVCDMIIIWIYLLRAFEIVS